MPWKDIARERQSHRDASIAAVLPTIPDISTVELPLNVSHLPRKYLTPKEVEITESSTTLLLDNLATKKTTCTEVVTAFLRRAGIAQKLTNCITELIPARALERAQFLDDHIAKTGKPLGPLHGLPISVKEHIGMKDLDLNAGFCGWVGRKSPDDAHILRILWEAGAVFYARTTEPQSLMHLETASNIYGTTVNPYNRNLTSGGSSGGEGALIGMRGSCLGIGTDIGGSIRSPAANNGVYGLRPTSYRLPVEGWSATMFGAEQIIPVIGPLSTSLDGIKIFMKTIIDSQPWLVEPSLIPIPWRAQMSYFPEKKIKIGVMYDDGVVTPHPPVTRAMKELVEKLKSSSQFEIVEWKGMDHEEAWTIISSLYFADGGSQELAALKLTDEPMLPMTRHILQDNPNVRELTITEVWEWTVKRETYKAAYAKLWNEAGLDVILCPTGPGAAPRLETAKWWGYTSLWNLLDYPAAIFPVSKVIPQLDVANTSYTPLNERDKYNHDMYDAEYFRDAPISLQVVGRRYDDEKVLEALTTIIQETGLPFVDPFTM